MLAYIEKNYKYELKKQTQQYQLYHIYKGNDKFILKVLPMGEYHLDIISKIENKHIPKIKDIFIENDYIYIIEEYYEGIPIYKVNNMTEKKLVEYVLQICDALKSLHNHNLVHRNIKLSNLIITDENILILCGCENAAIKNEIGNKKDTRFIGDIAFAAPEQFSSSKSDVRSDIYSIGVLMKAILDYKCDDIYNGKYNYIINKCLEFNPEYRFQRVDEVKNEILNGYIKEVEDGQNNYAKWWYIYYFFSHYIIVLTIFIFITLGVTFIIDNCSIGNDSILMPLAVLYYCSSFFYLYFAAKRINKRIKYQYLNRDKLKLYILIIKIIPIIIALLIAYRYY